LTAIVSIVAAAAAAAAAQGIRTHVGVGGGLTAPRGDYQSDVTGEGFKSGWQGIGFVDFDVLRSRVVLRVNATYGRNGSNDQLTADLTTRFGTSAEQHTRVLGGSVNVMYAFGAVGPVTPYLLGGIGIYSVGLTETSSVSTRDTALTKLGWDGGGGVRYGVGRAAVFLEARYFKVARVLDEGAIITGRFSTSTAFRCNRSA